jgi:hypothetical protein
MAAFLLWCVLFVVSWPVALVALVAYPILWLLFLPLRLLGKVVSEVVDLILAVVLLPIRLPARLLHL